MVLRPWHGSCSGDSPQHRSHRALTWLPSVLSRDNHRRRQPSVVFSTTFAEEAHSHKQTAQSDAPDDDEEDSEEEDLYSEAESAPSAPPDSIDEATRSKDEGPRSPSDRFRHRISNRFGHTRSTKYSGETSPAARTEPAFFDRNNDTIHGYSARVLSQLQEETIDRPLKVPNEDSTPLLSATSFQTHCDLQYVVLELHRSSVLNQLASAKWLRYDQFVSNTSIEDILQRQKYEWEKSQKPVISFPPKSSDKYSPRELLRPHLKRGNRRFVKRFSSQIPNEYRNWWEHLLFELLAYQMYTSAHDMSRLCVCTRQFVRTNVNSSIHLCTWKLPRERCQYCGPVLRYMHAWQLDAISSKNEDLLSSFEILVARPNVTVAASNRCGGSMRRFKQPSTPLWGADSRRSKRYVPNKRPGD
eukprot:Protomagalhaensia_sp_Gyna_25__3558@NODE_319_length_3900_cov_98_727273_g249_i0_p1_GENE_NODE_319_length_3900_cov_98_727273_g249_i0NODE_319_length_3900_cov_98_727273_g249_i0_p1_ORF_typecomplete_len414_score37_99DUF4611/PF15387_6/0_065DUF4771/PF15995_5/0_19_NODE_319_length_3900_cov_98_727273_g249_i01741415